MKQGAEHAALPQDSAVSLRLTVEPEKMIEATPQEWHGGAASIQNHEAPVRQSRTALCCGKPRVATQRGKIQLL